LDVSKSKALTELYCVDNNFDCYYLMEELGF